MKDTLHRPSPTVFLKRRTKPKALLYKVGTESLSGLSLSPFGIAKAQEIF